MEFLVAPIILIGLVLFIAWPLVQDKTTPEELDETSELEIATEEKENALANLKDIEMDYRMGKLSDEDYAKLKEDFEEQAVAALQKLEAVQKKKKRK